jgi:hypothetical protein
LADTVTAAIVEAVAADVAAPLVVTVVAAVAALLLDVALPCPAVLA